MLWDVTAVFVGLSWVAFQLWLYRGWRSLRTKGSQNKASHLVQEGISVVIPFRNESENLTIFLTSLKTLRPPERLAVEWIFVDDGSNDGSASLILRESQEHLIPGIVKVVDSGGPGKKAAQRTGVQEARYPWILFSDADCQWPSNRLRMLEQLPINGNVPVVCGPVYYDSATPALFSLEFESLVYAGAALIGLGFPVLANGTNILCRKEAWIDCVEEIHRVPTPSGDDVFLIQCIARRFGRRAVLFVNHPDNTVFTRGPHTLREFLIQRIRWVSKTLLFPSLIGKAIALYVWLFHGLLLLCTAAALFKGYCACMAVLGLSKILGDGVFYFFVSPSAQHMSWKKFLYFLPAEFFTTFHFVCTPPIAWVRGYSWKGRYYAPGVHGA